MINCADENGFNTTDVQISVALLYLFQNTGVLYVIAASWISYSWTHYSVASPRESSISHTWTHLIPLSGGKCFVLHDLHCDTLKVQLTLMLIALLNG